MQCKQRFSKEGLNSGTCLETDPFHPHFETVALLGKCFDIREIFSFVRRNRSRRMLANEGRPSVTKHQTNDISLAITSRPLLLPKVIEKREGDTYNFFSSLCDESKPRMIIPQVIFLVLWQDIQPPIPAALVPLAVFDSQPRVEDAAHESTEQQQGERCCVAQRIARRLSIQEDVRGNQACEIPAAVLYCCAGAAFVVASH